MRIFLTGATGFVGRAVLAALLEGGHQVTALVRSAEKAAAVERAGATAVVGDLARPDEYVVEAAACDGIVHTGFEYLPDGSENHDTDERATLALLAAARVRGGRLVYTSNAYLFCTGGGDAVDEEVDPARLGVTGRRIELERRALDAGAAVVRPGFVYGGLGGTLPDLFAAAHRNGRLGHAGRDVARGSYIYHHDLAALYGTIVDHQIEGVYHGTDGRPLSALELLRAVCGVTGIPDDLQPLAPGHGLDAHTVDILDRDVAVVSPGSRALGWRPRYVDFRQGVGAAYAEWAPSGLSRIFSSR